MYWINQFLKPYYQLPFTKFYLSMIKKVFAYTSIYTAFGTTLACIATDSIFELHTLNVFFIFMFFATLCTYNMHWFFTPNVLHDKERENWSIANKYILATISIISFVICAIILYRYLWHQIFFILPLAMAALIYTAPKIPIAALQPLQKLVVGKTLYLAVAWTYATVYLPIILHQQSLTSVQWQFVWHRFFLVFIICGLFDYKDKVEDTQGGIKSMIIKASVGLIATIGQVLLSMSILGAFRLVPDLHTIDAVLNFVPLILLMFFFKRSMQSTNETWYYFVVDGLLFINGFIYLLMLFVKGS
jgi:hypothetical protein